MKRLFVFTSAFPFPAKSMETYLETECQYYDKFDEVILFALGGKKHYPKSASSMSIMSRFIQYYSLHCGFIC